MSKLAKILERQEFYPGLVGLFTNPFYFDRQELLKNIRNLAPKVKGRVLDAGCGTKPYAELFKDISYVGLEIDTPENREKAQIDFFYDGKTFPFPDKEFDGALSSQVLEHVFEPNAFLQELNRVLKPNGVLLLTVPFMWEEHEKPYDFGRYSSFGLKSILERNGFEVIEQMKTLNDIRAIFQLLNCQLRKILNFKNKKIKFICYVFCFGALNIMGSILYYLFPKNSDFYIDNVVLAKKISDAKI